MNAVTSERVQAALRRHCSPRPSKCVDDSHLHAGHAGAKEGRHFTVRVTSTAFTGLSRVARHRLVYDALRSLDRRGNPCAGHRRPHARRATALQFSILLFGAPDGVPVLERQFKC